MEIARLQEIASQLRQVSERARAAGIDIPRERYEMSLADFLGSIANDIDRIVEESPEAL